MGKEEQALLFSFARHPVKKQNNKTWRGKALPSADTLTPFELPC